MQPAFLPSNNFSVSAWTASSSILLLVSVYKPIAHTLMALSVVPMEPAYLMKLPTYFSAIAAPVITVPPVNAPLVIQPRKTLVSLKILRLCVQKVPA